MRQVDAQREFDLINTKLNIIIEKMGIEPSEVKDRLQDILISEEEAKEERTLPSSSRTQQHPSLEVSHD